MRYTRRRSALRAVVFALAVVVGTTAATEGGAQTEPTTFTVAAITGRLTSWVQMEGNRFRKVTLDEGDLIQLATGENPKGNPPRSLSLALRVDCETGAADIIVFGTEPVEPIECVTGIFRLEANQADKRARNYKSVGPIAFLESGGLEYGIENGTGSYFAKGKFIRSGGLAGCYDTADIDITGTLTVLEGLESETLLIETSRLRARNPVGFRQPENGESMGPGNCPAMASP